MQILYYDNHVVVVNKAAGLATQSEEEDSVEQQARLWAKKQFCKRGDVFLYAVHRLDKPVSGILLLGKTSKALERLHASFRAQQMKKTYIALLEGALSEKKGVLEDYLVQEAFCASVAHEKNPQAKRCRLSFQVLEQTSLYSLVEIDLETGRYHQIRCQFAHRGHPIVGDLKYGAKFIGKYSGEIALHHQKMQFPHPITKEILSFEAQPPREWKGWAQELSVFL